MKLKKENEKDNFYYPFFLLERNNILDKKVCDTLELDIIDGCNAKCVCCPRGLGLMGNSMKKMDIELYKRIIKKSKTGSYSKSSFV